MKIEHHVKIGQIKTASTGEILKTVLGSCVGIALFLKESKQYALAHCLLPEAPKDSPNFEARYVDQAIPNMLKALGLTLREGPLVEAIIAGGGRMMDTEKNFIKYIVGEANLTAARVHLAHYNIPIIAIEPGLDQGTKMTIDCSTGMFEVEKIKKVS